MKKLDTLIHFFDDPCDDLLIKVNPVIDYTVRALCVEPYEAHPKGCPNVGKCDRCPPEAPLFDRFFDTSKPIYAIVNEFDLGSHVERLRVKHPDWSERQLRCVLYWQGTARKQLREKIGYALASEKCQGYVATWCPEGMGVNVSETLVEVGIHLEWPPTKIARQVAFVGERAK